jgi:hypothetical protein
LLAGFFLIAPPAFAANIAGTACPAFPADNWWHADVSKLPVHPSSAAWMSHMGAAAKLHPDFGPSFGEIPVPYGMPITVVGGAHPKVTVGFDYPTQSDNVPYPLGADTKPEGGQWLSGDRHTIVVDKSSCKVYETYDTSKAGGWHAGSGAVWDLKSNKLRPNGWTSADAAGLPILPGLLRWREVHNGYVDHAIRFTTDVTDRRHIWPARHDAGSVSDPAYPPMGARFRLKASYRPTGLGRDARVVVAAMKRYGLVLADNGSPWFFQGEVNSRWSDQLISDLKRIPASAFVAVDTSKLRVNGTTGRVR